MTNKPGQVCGGLALGDLPWKAGSKTDGFVRGKRAPPGKPAKRSEILACLQNINDCGTGAGKFALGTKALKSLKRQVCAPRPMGAHTAAARMRSSWCHSGSNTRPFSARLCYARLIV